MRVVSGRRLVSPALVGRDAELESLVAAVLAPPTVVTLQGDAGLGKTRLVTELADRQELAAHRWAIGACSRIREPFPLGPVTEAIRGLGDGLAAATLSPVAGALRPLLPELSDWLLLAALSFSAPADAGHRGALPVSVTTKEESITFDDMRQLIAQFEATGQVTFAGAGRLEFCLLFAERAVQRGTPSLAITDLEEFKRQASDPRYVPSDTARDELIVAADQMIAQLT
ncbi:MAG: AAA family ATPase [Propionibacteriales bacterium]|nr:AAA family ATPase [Propionibacteriales bacterium]